MLELSTVKNFLRIEHDEDDELITMYISAAAEYIKSACGNDVDFDSAKVNTVLLMLISDFYEKRTPYGQGSYSRSVASMLTQIRLETESDG